jgi:hypothetical protein
VGDYFSHNRHTLKIYKIEKKMSVEWTGFYKLGVRQFQEKIENLRLEADNSIKGSGSDTNGPFTVTGKYEAGSSKMQFTKTYTSLNEYIIYDG